MVGGREGRVGWLAPTLFNIFDAGVSFIKYKDMGNYGICGVRGCYQGISGGLMRSVFVFFGGDYG